MMPDFVLCQEFWWAGVPPTFAAIVLLAITARARTLKGIVIAMMLYLGVCFLWWFVFLMPSLSMVSDYGDRAIQIKHDACRRVLLPTF